MLYTQRVSLASFTALLLCKEGYVCPNAVSQRRSDRPAAHDTRILLAGLPDYGYDESCTQPWCNQGVLQATGAAFRGNRARAGGAIYVAYNTPLISLAATTLADNEATGPAGGGAVFFNAPRGVLQLSGGTVLRNNTATRGSGGGVMVEAARRVQLSDTELSGNAARGGGGGAVAFAKPDLARDLATCVNGETLTLTSFNGNFALVQPQQLVPTIDLDCKWVVLPPDASCRVEVEITSLTAVSAATASVQVVDMDSGQVLFATNSPDGSVPGPLTSSGGGIRVQYISRNAGSGLIFYGGMLASFRSVCPELADDVALLSALYGQGSADAAALLRQSALGGSVMVLLDNVTAGGNAAAAGNGGVIDLEMSQGAARTRTGLLVVSASTMVRVPSLSTGRHLRQLAQSVLATAA